MVVRGPSVLVHGVDSRSEPEQLLQAGSPVPPRAENQRSPPRAFAGVDLHSKTPPAESVQVRVSLRARGMVAEGGSPFPNQARHRRRVPPDDSLGEGSRLLLLRHWFGGASAVTAWAACCDQGTAVACGATSEPERAPNGRPSPAASAKAEEQLSSTILRARVSQLSFRDCKSSV